MTTPAESVRAAAARRFPAKRGERALPLAPPLDEAQLRDQEHALPEPIRELLRVTSGFPELEPFDVPVSQVDLTGGAFEDAIGMEDLFPRRIPIAHDGCGNYWIVDFVPGAPDLGPVYLLNHDPAAVVWQCAGLGAFVAALLHALESPEDDALAWVRDTRTHVIWLEEPGVLTAAECAASGDATVAAFAQRLDEHARVRDLRTPRVGDGFTLRHDEVLRCGDEPVFAYRAVPRRSLWQRLWGRG